MGDHVDPYRHYLHYPHPTAESQTVSNESLEDYYQGENPAVCEELNRLFRAFRTEIAFGQRHYAPSSSWRDELTTKSSALPTPPRFVVRLHLFEKQSQQPGRYLGFVSLRPPGSTGPVATDGAVAAQAFRYVIDAELTTPKYMQRPRYHVLTTTAASARLGVMPFRSAVYSAPGLGEDRGSTCVHLAVSQALHLIMGRFGCRPISQIEFDWHLWLAADKVDNMSIGEVGKRGATLREALEVIRASCNGGGIRMTVEPRDDSALGRLSGRERTLAARFITDALACGLPVVAIVRTGNLLSPEVRSRLPGDRLNAPHAVLILGMHLLHSEEEAVFTESSECTENEMGTKGSWDQREDRAELPGRLVIHDTLTRGPYFECIISDFLDAAEDAFFNNPGTGPDDSRGVHMLAVGPEGMEMSHNLAREHTLRNLRLNLEMAFDADTVPLPDILALKGYLAEAGVNQESAMIPEDWRLICRLLSTPELRSRYDDMEHSHTDFIELPVSYFWVVEIRHPRAKPRRGKDTVACPSDLSPAMVLVWDCTTKAELPETERMDMAHAPSPQVVFRFKSKS